MLGVRREFAHGVERVLPRLQIRKYFLYKVEGGREGDNAEARRVIGQQKQHDHKKYAERLEEARARGAHERGAYQERAARAHGGTAPRDRRALGAGGLDGLHTDDMLA